jgi:hypothetical protein
MVIQPSPYSYVWFGAQQRDFNVEVKVGCKDPNSVDYCDDCQVEDNSRCGPCNAGWTKTNDPNMKCWAVGSMSVDCANGQIFYHPMGCVDASQTGYAGGTEDCTCGGNDRGWKNYVDGCGQQIDERGRKQRRKTGAVSSRYPNIKYKPSSNKPGYVKHYANNASWPRVLWAVTTDGTPVFVKGSKSWVSSTEESGGLIEEKVKAIIKANCGGEITRVQLTEEDRKTIPTILGESSAASGPAVTATTATPASGLSNTSITTQSGSITPVTSGTTETPSLGRYVWPAIGVIGILGYMKLKGGKKK